MNTFLLLVITIILRRDTRFLALLIRYEPLDALARAIYEMLDPREHILAPLSLVFAGDAIDVALPLVGDALVGQVWRTLEPPVRRAVREQAVLERALLQDYLALVFAMELHSSAMGSTVSPVISFFLASAHLKRVGRGK